jgi:hypothetical protein
MVLETSWGTPSGWIIVRDLLLMGPWHHEDQRSRTHRRATDYDADHVLLRTSAASTARCRSSWTASRCSTTGAARQWVYGGEAYEQAVAASRHDLELTLTTDLRIGIEGGRATACTLLKEGEHRFCARGASTRRRGPPTRPTTGSCGRPTTGSTGWPEATS